MFVAVFLLFFFVCFFLLLLFVFFIIFFFFGGGGLFCFVVVVVFFFFLVSAIDALDLVRNTKKEFCATQKRNSEQTEYVHIRERGAVNRV